MQKYKIKISDLAEQDLEFAADYIAYDLKNPSAAVNTVQGIRKQINKLQNFPGYWRYSNLSLPWCYKYPVCR